MKISKVFKTLAITLILFPVLGYSQKKNPDPKFSVVEVQISNGLQLQELISNGLDIITGKAASRSKKWLKENRTNIDLNQYKTTNRFKKAFLEFKNKNLNHLVFEPDSSITFIDFDKKYVGVNCGKYILRETAQRKDYLCIHAIYDYENNTLKKALIQNTGCFLE